MIQPMYLNDLPATQNFSRLFSQAPAPIAIYKGRELRYVFVNDAYAEIFNYRQILGKTVREAFPELAGQPFYGILENVFDSGEPYYGNETPALIDLHNNGVLVTRYYNLVYTPYKNDDGQIEGVMAFGHDVTTQVVARKKEKESDARFRNIVEQSTDPILILKGTELLLDVANQALFNLWGIGEESIGKPFLEILPEMKNQVFYELLLDVYHNGTTHHGNETPGYFQRPGGAVETHYFNFIYQPYRQADGAIAGVLILATDVTAQVIAKQELIQSEVNFRNMILQSPVAMCVLKGPEYIVEIANEKMYRIWGKSEDEVLKKPIFEGLPEAKGQGIEKYLLNVYLLRHSFSANERPILLPRDGKIETTYINFVYEPYREGKGNISGIIVVATDVTEQVIARQKIEYAEENARLAVESAELGTYEINALTGETITSPRFSEIWGFDNKDTRREHYAATIELEDQPVRKKALEESVATGNLQYEVRINRPDGSQRWIRVKGRTLYDGQKAPVRLLGVVQDLTEQKLFAQELSKQVEVRTKELQQANQRLERSNEELDQFAYIASHDLQEPLRKIHIFNSLVLQQPGLGETTTKYVEKVSASAKRMSGLITDILDYSRLSQGNVAFTETDLNAILQQVLSDFELLITEKQAQVQYDTLPVIQAIPLQMNQLLFNLLGNSLKFTRTGVKPVITLTANKLSDHRKTSCWQLSEEREYYELIINDNGLGFNEDYADKIFTIFQTLNEKSIYGGHGIGLALCRKIVTTHSGIIRANGKKGAGATFTIILPAFQ